MRVRQNASLANTGCKGCRSGGNGRSCEEGVEVTFSNGDGLTWEVGLEGLDVLVAGVMAHIPEAPPHFHATLHNASERVEHTHIASIVNKNYNIAH